MRIEMWGFTDLIRSVDLMIFVKKTLVADVEKKSVFSSWKDGMAYQVEILPNSKRWLLAWLCLFKLPRVLSPPKNKRCEKEGMAWGDTSLNSQIWSPGVWHFCIWEDPCPSPWFLGRYLEVWLLLRDCLRAQQDGSGEVGSFWIHRV